MIDIPDVLIKEFQVMFKAATEASFVCKKYRERIGRDLGIMTKSDESPVTRKYQILTPISYMFFSG